MTTIRPEPRIEAEPDFAPRLEPETLPAVMPVLPRVRLRPPLALTGLAVLALGLPAIWTAGLVVAEFARSPALGWVAIAVAAAGFGLLGAAAAREISGLAALRTVDRLRAELASGDVRRMRAAARRWLRDLPDSAALLPALDAVPDAAALLALLRAGPGAGLRRQVDELGRTAAWQAGALVAATPAPALDVLTIGWRGLRLVRQVAALHGLRPGLFGTLALLRRTAVAAASVAVTEMAVNAAAHALVSHPLLRHALGDMAGAGVAARRMVVLARAAALACTPLPGED